MNNTLLPIKQFFSNNAEIVFFRNANDEIVIAKTFVECNNDNFEYKTIYNYSYKNYDINLLVNMYKNGELTIN